MNEHARRAFVVLLLCVARLRRTIQTKRFLKLIVISLSPDVMRLWLRPLFCLRRDNLRDNFHIAGGVNVNRLRSLEECRYRGKFELQLRWPDTELDPQHWRQKSNPYLRSGAVEGYEAISCPHSANAWGGLQSGHARAVLNGSTDGCWYYAVGSYQDWNGGIPGPKHAVQKVELRTRRSNKDQWVLIMRQTAPHPYWTKTKV